MTPLIVGIGGTVRPHSSSEAALRLALDAAEARGAATRCFGGDELAQLPMYAPDDPDRVPVARQLVAAVRDADGVIIASPGYHGSVSGLVKNALDYLEDLRDDARTYLSGRAVGCVTTAYGWQATVTTLEALRSIVHALRGWPTPLGVTINSSTTRFSAEAGTDDMSVRTRLDTLAGEVLTLASTVHAADSLASVSSR